MWCSQQDSITGCQIQHTWHYGYDDFDGVSPSPFYYKYEYIPVAHTFDDAYKSIYLCLNLDYTQHLDGLIWYDLHDGYI